ncbi:MAG: hypothetical protein ABSB34_12500 [Candidatus Limnocylindrales bacterium]|jgi:hypothetical protein
MTFPPPGNGHGSAIPANMVPWLVLGILIFVAVIVVFSITAAFLWGPRLMRKLSGTTGPIKNGEPSDAIIESIADTGMTVTMRGVGSYAPDYRFVLQVSPVGGGAPYQVQTNALVPRLFIPMVVPGARVGVLIDPTDPTKVSIDFGRMGGASAAGWAANPASGASAGIDFNLEANSQPAVADVARVEAMGSGAPPFIRSGDDHILATGTHGTAVITTAQPTGRTVREVDSAVDPHLQDDPIWLFTVEVSLAGERPFPAVFSHRVPLAKVASVAPGVKLAVAVDPTNKSQAVAIDWDRSPISA